MFKHLPVQGHDPFLQLFVAIIPNLVVLWPLFLVDFLFQGPGGQFPETLQAVDLFRFNKISLSANQLLKCPNESRGLGPAKIDFEYSLEHAEMF